MWSRQHLHFYVVLLDFIQPHFNIKKVLGNRAGPGAHAQDDLLPLFVLFDSHVSFGGFEFFQIFLGVEMAVKINVHGSVSLDRYGTLVTKKIKRRHLSLDHELAVLIHKELAGVFHGKLRCENKPVPQDLRTRQTPARFLRGAFRGDGNDR